MQNIYYIYASGAHVCVKKTDSFALVGRSLSLIFFINQHILIFWFFFIFSLSVSFDLALLHMRIHNITYIEAPLARVVAVVEKHSFIGEKWEINLFALHAIVRPGPQLYTYILCMLIYEEFYSYIYINMNIYIYMYI